MTDKNSALPLLDRRRLLASAVLATGLAALPAKAQTKPLGQRQTDGPLTAEVEEGPYYLPLNLLRSDITEGLPGIPIDIHFSVIGEDGTPYVGAAVDIWHCNAQGIYSGFQDPGGQSSAGVNERTFLRGVQPVDAGGGAIFHSIYPGWYHGRTTHVHFKIRHGTVTNLTSQFFLPDTLSEYLYSQVEVYRRAELRDTLNSTDGIAIQAGDSVEGSVRETKGRYLITLAVRVDRSAIASERRFGDHDGPPPGSLRNHPPGGPPRGRPPEGPPPGSRGEPRGDPKGRHGPPPEHQALQGEQRVVALLPDAKRLDRQRGRGGPPPA